VLLPGGVLPQELSQDRTAEARPFVVELRGLPGAARAASRNVRKTVVARPVRGVYLIPARQPKSLFGPIAESSPPGRLLWRPSSLRAPPAFA